MGEGGAKWDGKGRERCFLKEKAFIMEQLGRPKTVCVCLCMRILSELVFFSRMCTSVCVLLSCVCVCECLASHREPTFDQSVIGAKTKNGDPFSCPATSAAL